MSILQDGGLSCVRSHAEDRGGEMERYLARRLAAPGRFVGRLVCPCGLDDRWTLELAGDGSGVRAVCACREAILPVYAGAPVAPARYQVVEGPCGKSCRAAEGAVGVGIGYAGPVPPVGTAAAERAVEVVLAQQCRQCKRLSSPWRLWLPAPPAIRGDEPWMMRIQGLRWSR